MELRPLPLDQIPAALQRNVDPNGPPPMRMMAARGLVPAAPPDLAVMLYQLTFDAEAAIAKSARDTLAGTPTAVALTVAAAPLPAPVLDLLAQLFSGNEQVIERTLSNGRTDDATFASVAAHCSESISEIVASNEVRLLRAPTIIEALFLNPHARMSTVDRIVELAKRHKLKFEHVAVLDHLMDDMRDPVANEVPASDQLFKTILAESMAEEAAEEAELARLNEEEKVAVRVRQNEVHEEGRKSSSKQAEIGKMSISQKVRLATLGSKADRDYLVRDNNRLVHMAAVLSPKVQPPDITAWTTNKTIPDNVLVYIANSGRYRRNYTIVHNLCKNPKTPFRVTATLVNTLIAADQVKLSKNRNIPPQLQKLVKNNISQRAKSR